MKKYIDMAVRWMVYIYISILPWIIFRKELLFNTEEKKIMPVKTAGNTDYFLYGKAAFTIAVGILLFILLFVEITVFHEKLLDFKTRRDRIFFWLYGNLYSLYGDVNDIGRLQKNSTVRRCKQLRGDVGAAVVSCFIFGGKVCV